MFLGSREHNPTRRLLACLGLFGGLGGALNAWLCYAKLPVPIPGGELFGGPSLQFHWSIIPGGALHGALLAAIPVGYAAVSSRMPRWVQWALVPVAGWLSGWLAWAAILWVGGFQDEGWRMLNPGAVARLITWPVAAAGHKTDAVWIPYLYFGLVGTVFSTLLLLARRAASRDAVIPILIGIASGVLGSLWWWIAWGRWYFSLLHGTIWGALVGYGLWRRGHPHQAAVDVVHH